MSHLQQITNVPTLASHLDLKQETALLFEERLSHYIILLIILFAYNFEIEFQALWIKEPGMVVKWGGGLPYAQI